MSDPVQAFVIPLTIMTSIISTSLTLNATENAQSTFNISPLIITPTGNIIRSVIYSDAWLSMAMIALTLSVIAAVVLYFRRKTAKMAPWATLSWILAISFTFINSVLVATFLGNFDNLSTNGGAGNSSVQYNSGQFRGSYSLGMISTASLALIFSVGAFFLSGVAPQVGLSL
jgi:hypothetical protein